jgi:hypothetical protein
MAMVPLNECRTPTLTVSSACEGADENASAANAEGIRRLIIKLFKGYFV